MTNETRERIAPVENPETGSLAYPFFAPDGRPVDENGYVETDRAYALAYERAYAVAIAAVGERFGVPSDLVILTYIDLDYLWYYQAVTNAGQVSVERDGRIIFA